MLQSIAAKSAVELGSEKKVMFADNRVNMAFVAGFACGMITLVVIILVVAAIASATLRRDTPPVFDRTQQSNYHVSQAPLHGALLFYVV